MFVDKEPGKGWPLPLVQCCILQISTCCWNLLEVCACRGRREDKVLQLECKPLMVEDVALETATALDAVSLMCFCLHVLGSLQARSVATTDIGESLDGHIRRS